MRNNLLLRTGQCVLIALDMVYCTGLIPSLVPDDLETVASIFWGSELGAEKERGLESHPLLIGLFLLLRRDPCTQSLLETKRPYECLCLVGR